MARLLAPRFYEVSPTETLTITITGSDDPLVALDDTTLDVKEGQPFQITPQMLSGVGAHHRLGIVLLFPSNGTATPGYTITVDGPAGTLETVKKPEPDLDHTAKVELDIRVA